MKKLSIIAVALAAACTSMAAVTHTIVVYAKATAHWARLNIGVAMHNELGRQGLILGANNFSKEESVAFDQVFEKFEDLLVISNMFKKKEFDSTAAERNNNTFWRPMPYIAQSFVGLDQGANFDRNYTQLSVPSSLGYSHSVPLTLTATELRDALQEKSLGEAAMERLASDINVDCSNMAAMTGTIVVKRTGAATGFDDVAACDTAMTRVGISKTSRIACYSPGDYNNMASNLAARQTLNGKTLTAYEQAAVGKIASFDTFGLDYAYRLTAAAGVTCTINGANQRYIPKATSTAAGTGETANVDNRYQNIVIGVTSGTVKAGDAFTIAGVNEVHHITKQDTGSLKTFRIMGQVSGTAGGAGTYTIAPPIISADSAPTDPEVQYKNCTATPANGAAITWLNTVSAPVNPFWHADAFEIIPGKYMPAADSGLSIMSATTKNGVVVTMARQGNIDALKTKYRWDVFYGLVNKQPEMTGIELFGQT